MQKCLFVASLLVAGIQAGSAAECLKKARELVAPVKWDPSLVEDLPNGWQMRGSGFGKSSWAKREIDLWYGKNRVVLGTDNGFINFDQQGRKDKKDEKVKRQYLPYQIDFFSPARHSIPHTNDQGEEVTEKPHLEVQISMRINSEFYGSESDRLAAMLSVFFNEDKKLSYQQAPADDAADDEIRRLQDEDEDQDPQESTERNILADIGFDLTSDEDQFEVEMSYFMNALKTNPFYQYTRIATSNGVCGDEEKKPKDGPEQGITHILLGTVQSMTTAQKNGVHGKSNEAETPQVALEGKLPAIYKSTNSFGSEAAYLSTGIVTAASLLVWAAY